MELMIIMACPSYMYPWSYVLITYNVRKHFFDNFIIFAMVLIMLAKPTSECSYDTHDKVHGCSSNWSIPLVGNRAFRVPV